MDRLHCYNNLNMFLMNRNFYHLHGRECFRSGIRELVGSWDERKNVGGNSKLLQMRFSCFLFVWIILFLFPLKEASLGISHLYQSCWECAGKYDKKPSQQKMNWVIWLAVMAQCCLEHRSHFLDGPQDIYLWETSIKICRYLLSP